MEPDEGGDFERTEGYFVYDVSGQRSFADERSDTNEKSGGWAYVCRLCAKTSDHVVPIFEAEGAQHDLSDKIHKYLPIRVAETDTLPIQLCYHCAATILAWHELLEGCSDAQRQLAEMHSERTSEEQIRLRNDQDSSEEVKDPEPRCTDKEDSEAIQPGETEQSGEDSKPRSDIAEETFRLFLDKQNACRGTRRIKNDISHVAFDGRKISREANIATRISSQEPASEDHRDVDTEISKNDNSRVVCEGTILGNNCICQQGSHEDTLTARKTYKCADCSKIFRLKDSLTRHQRIHRDERPFTCHVCGKQFRDSGGLSRHLKDVHAKLKKFTCDICANSFSSKATRDDHRRTHTGERPYNCDNCEKTFKSRACLYIHSKLHTDQFPYPCVHCEKKFRRRQEMLLHLTTHTGERNYSCDVCSRRFRVKTEVARHKLTHSDEKPYICAVCGLSFRQKRYLNNHVKSRHPKTAND